MSIDIDNCLSEPKHSCQSLSIGVQLVGPRGCCSGVCRPCAHSSSWCAETGGRPVASSEAAAGPVKTGDGESTRLFIRQTSGLVRELGIPAAIGISLASVAVVNTFINFNAGLTDFPKADMYLPLVAAAVIWLT